VNDANERSGTWNADLFLYESWPVTPGFSPQTEVVNEVARSTENTDFDLTTLDGTKCTRTRRLRLTLHTRYNLRRFPFDRQRLEFAALRFGVRLLKGLVREPSDRAGGRRQGA